MTSTVNKSSVTFHTSLLKSITIILPPIPLDDFNTGERPSRGASIQDESSEEEITPDPQPSAELQAAAAEITTELPAERSPKDDSYQRSPTQEELQTESSPKQDVVPLPGIEGLPRPSLLPISQAMRSYASTFPSFHNFSSMDALPFSAFAGLNCPQKRKMSPSEGRDKFRSYSASRKSAQAKKTKERPPPPSTPGIVEQARKPDSPNSADSGSPSGGDHSGKEVASNFPGASAMQSASNFPGASGMQSATNFPGASAMQSASNFPGSLAMQSASNFPAASAMQSASNFPGASAMQYASNFPGASAMQYASNFPGASAMQSASNFPGASAMQSASNFPGPSAMQSTLSSTSGLAETQSSAISQPAPTPNRGMNEEERMRHFPEYERMRQLLVPVSRSQIQWSAFLHGNQRNGSLPPSQPPPAFHRFREEPRDFNQPPVNPYPSPFRFTANRGSFPGIAPSRLQQRRPTPFPFKTAESTERRPPPTSPNTSASPNTPTSPTNDSE
ncbi:hypothetical protein HNY73_005506 [Argiope bruennichi]|uniref:Uncharacterized protein n=1 Tax=Argiope bruennichi TaxID=94029 RepID=A0A8T0FM58_ARGBR|nr:hypothetical protein HNY73_005506 [Argiope bruennichi]